jgi:sulfane dehydrogenase subunit SoxC
VSPEAVDVIFTGADRGVERGVVQDYQRSLPLAEALRDEALLAYEMNGAPLPVQHGFPVRLMIPGWYGMAHVKWLHRITVATEPFDGYQNAVAYRLKGSSDEPGEPVTRIRPRALMIPPGHPDFMSRNRFVEVGTHELTGRAWSGQPPVTRVEVSVDNGQSWFDAEVEPPPGRWAWSRWRTQWTVSDPGRYELLVRATDGTGAVQPVDQPWNTQGMANNMTQRITVYVHDR